MSNLRPRLCLLSKSPSGYGFHLHGEKGKAGQFIRLVEPDSPAEAAGLRAGDRLAFVNGERVEGESHQQVVARIRATPGALELVVLDDETAELLKKHDLPCRREYATEGIPLPGGDGEEDRHRGEDTQSNGTPREASPAPGENGEGSLERLSVSSKDGKAELRPRLCHMKKGSSGYGFNLHSKQSKPGQYIRAVDQDSAAQRAGLKPQDKIIQVNGMSVLGMQHAEVVAAIKAGGDQTSLLVIDPDTEHFFKSCNTVPTEKHLSGPLPEPAANRASEEEEEVNGKAAVEEQPKMSKVTPSPSNASSKSNASLPRATASTPPPEMERAPEPSRDVDTGPALGLSLAQARERAHQKRVAKKAPPMDWSKRNELFSNL